MMRVIVRLAANVLVDERLGVDVVHDEIQPAVVVQIAYAAPYEKLGWVSPHAPTCP
jgi:hypothetical protein